eukprot:899226_1
MMTALILLQLALLTNTFYSDTPIHCDTDGKLPPPEFDALQDLYYATNGPSWYHPWDIHSHESPCAWQGVCCNYYDPPHKSNIIMLNLSSNNLQGTIPPTLTNMQFLNTILFQ